VNEVWRRQRRALDNPFIRALDGPILLIFHRCSSSTQREERLEKRERKYSYFRCFSRKKRGRTYRNNAKI
jgi:hypothetical protein